MPVKAYIGLPRAGKTYEVVVNVILPSLRQGRRVVSNIAGLNFDLMQQHLFAEGMSEDQIGSLVSVTSKQVEDPFFWLTDEDDLDNPIAFIRAGDQIALDEIWRFWKKRGDIHPRAQNFFRMHGHLPDPKTGLICEIALLTQSIRDINENIRDVIAETYQSVKNTKLGSSKSYIVHVYQKGSISKSDFIRTLPPRFYNKDYFPFYLSHSKKQDGSAEALENNADDRANILKGGFFKIGIPLALILLLAGGYGVKRFFKGHDDIELKKMPEIQNVNKNSEVINKKNIPDFDVQWRVIGWYKVGNNITVSLVNSNQKLRIISNPSTYKISGYDFEVLLPDGSYANTWTTFNKSHSPI